MKKKRTELDKLEPLLAALEPHAMTVMGGEITPDSPVVIASGTGVWNRAEFDAFFSQVISLGMEIDTRGPNIGDHEERLGRRTGKSRGFAAPYGAPRKPTNPERDAWNAAVDQRKANKLARKAPK